MNKLNIPVAEIIEWDILNWSQIIPEWTPIVEKLPRDGKVLAVGERDGGLSLWLALLGFNVTCTDRIGPTEDAGKLHKKYGVADKVTYDELDIVNCDWEGEQYDLIVIKSVLGGVMAVYGDHDSRNFDVQKKAVNNMHHLLKPGGILLSVENMKGNLLLHQLRKMKGKDKGWHHFSWQEIQELYGSYSDVKTKSFGVLPTLFGNNIVNRIAFFLNKYILNILPPSTKYVAITTAKK
ncbi:MAG: methyltransferase domain-containing protein [Flavipsychrobacter sp.]